MKPRKLPVMKDAEIYELLKEQILCRIAFSGKDGPHIAPFQYALVDGQPYFHFTNYGKKIGFLEQNDVVCVEIEKYTQDLSEYKFVVLTGRLKIVTNLEERAFAIQKLADTAKAKRLSENFLMAHGFNKEDSWNALTPDKPLVIVKLQNVTQKIGLKSP